MAHLRVSKEEIFDKIFDITLVYLRNKRFHLETKQEPKASETRYITKGLRKWVYERDRICQKCGSNHALEIDHIVPYSLGGKTERKNLRLLCRNCNQRARITAGLRCKNR